MRSIHTVYSISRCILGLYLILTATTAFAACIVHPGSTIGTDENWEPGTHYITGNITISIGVTLTIQPGAVVKFDNGTELRAVGRIDAEGAETNEIVFTSKNDDSVGEICLDSSGMPEPGDWDGIYLYGYGAYQGIGEFEHCRIRYGGNTGGAAGSNIHFHYSDSGFFRNSISEFGAQDGIRMDNCSLQISDNQISDNGGYGMYAFGSGAPILTDNTITDNGGYAVYMATNSVPAVAHDNTGSGNAINGFVLFGNVERDQTWWRFGSPDFPNVLMKNMNVNDGITLTISAGTVVKFDTEIELRVLGKIDANGTAGQEVVFTSLKDDTFDDDTNADGSATDPSAGDWDGIYLYGYGVYQGIGEFEHCRIRYGGNTDGATGSNLYFHSSDSGFFRNSISEFSAQDGLRMDNCSPQISDNQIRDNGGYGMYVFGSGAPILTNNTIADNDDYAVYMATNSVPAVAHDNTGSGNTINGFVLFGNVERDQAWWRFGSPDFPNVLMKNMNVNDGITLTILAGTVVKFDTAVEFRIVGKIDANGTADQEVVFTSLKDDTFDDDTNADGSATDPSAGDWDGIFLYGHSTYHGIGEFEHCRIRYGGNTGSATGSNLYFHYSDSGFFRNSISEFSDLDGIRVLNAAPAVINANLINNGRYGLNGTNCASLILNAIIWNNASGQIVSNVIDQPRVAYSDIQGGYPGDGNIDAEPLFTDITQGKYRLQQDSPCIDKGDPVEALSADYTAGDLTVIVDNVTQVEPGDLLWIIDGIHSESVGVAGTSAASIALENGFLNDYRVADGSHVYTYKSDYTHEPVPNGRRINMGAYGGSPLAAPNPCDGDFEPDGDIDGQDLLVFMADFNRTDCSAAGDCAGDFDSDGDVDVDDLQTIAANFGKPDCHK